MRGLGILGQFVLAVVMFWCAARSLGDGDIGWATAYLALGAMNMHFSIESLKS